MPSPQRAPLVALSPYTQATLSLAQPRTATSVDVSSLRAQLNTLDIALSTLLDQRLAVSARLTEAVALSSPVRLLSAEILAEIFIKASTPSHSSHDAPVLLSTIMLVCKHWRDVCFCTPELWSTISISPNEPDCLEKARRRLSRTKAVPLDITLDFSPRSSFSAQSQLPGSNARSHVNGPVPDHLLKSALSLLRPTIARWRTFMLLTPYRPQATSALALCSTPAPLLESLTVLVSNPMLHVSASEWDEKRKVIVPFAGVTPKLRECCLTSFWCERPSDFPQALQVHTAGPGFESAPQRCDMLRLNEDVVVGGERSRMVFPGVGENLVKLRLTGFWNDFAPDSEEMMDVLRQCPMLEELSFRNLTDVDPGEVDLNVPTATYIILSRLKHVSFHYSGVTRTCIFFHRTFLPALEGVELSFLDNITGCLKHLKQQSLLCSAWSPRTQKYDYGHPHAFLQWKGGERGCLPLKSLRIEASFFNELKLMRLLRRLPTLEKLELIDVEDISSNLLKGLTTSPLPNECALPRLETLNLEGCTTVEWDALKALIESRLPSSSASSSVASALHHRSSISPSSSSQSFIRGGAAVSSASQYARGQAMPETPRTSTSPLVLTTAEDQPPITPRKIMKLDLTRCSQISRERIQWLRMYVPEVSCDGGKNGWTGMDGV